MSEQIIKGAGFCSVEQGHTLNPALLRPAQKPRGLARITESSMHMFVGHGEDAEVATSCLSLPIPLPLLGLGNRIRESPAPFRTALHNLASRLAHFLQPNPCRKLSTKLLLDTPVWRVSVFFLGSFWMIGQPGKFDFSSFPMLRKHVQHLRPTFPTYTFNIFR